MDYKLEGREILFNNEQLGPYPDHLLKRVDRPTNWISDELPKRKRQNEAAKPLRRPEVEVGRTEPLYNGIMHVRHVLNTVKENPNPVAPGKAPIPDDPRVRSRHLKSFGYFLGADQVGICEVPEYAMFLDGPQKGVIKGPSSDKVGEPIDCDYKYAIVFIKRKHYGTTTASDGHDWIFNSCSHQVYADLTYWSEAMAFYLRRLGFDALASNNRNYVTVMPSLVIAAGMGECGRNGLAISPFFGSNFKACAVLTNMELEPDKPIDFGLQEYCNQCGICAQQCVSGAISKDNEMVEYNGYLKHKMDYVRCSTLQANIQNGSNCGRCTIVCPWHRPDSRPEDFKDWDGDLQFLYDSVNARAKYLREHDFVDEEYCQRKWWFDLVEDPEGKLIIPESSKYTVL